ncbi:MAG: hypothetical protein ACFNTC_00980, partial [Prevotella sp.]
SFTIAAVCKAFVNEPQCFLAEQKLDFTSQTYYMQKHWPQHFFAMSQFAHICIKKHHQALIPARILPNQAP